MSFESKLRNHLANEDFDDKINNFLNTYCKVAIVGKYKDIDSKNVDSKDLDSKEINRKDVKEENREENEYTLESYSIWKEYLSIIESHLSILQKQENLTNIEFKEEIEKVSKTNPFLVRLMIASWEFEQFISICREYYENIENENNDNEYYDNDNDNYDIAESKYDEKNDENDIRDCK